MHYKAPDNSLHFLDDDAYAHLLPEGSVQITDEEAESLRPVPEVIQVEEVTPLEKLQAFLSANPDVAAML